MPDTPPIPDGATVVWQQDDGWWRWRWTPDTEGRSEDPLVSHEGFETAEEACSSAREAYPGSLLRQAQPNQVVRRRRRRSRLWLILSAGVLLGLGLRRRHTSS